MTDFDINSIKLHSEEIRGYTAKVLKGLNISNSHKENFKKAIDRILDWDLQNLNATYGNSLCLCPGVCNCGSNGTTLLEADIKFARHYEEVDNRIRSILFDARKESDDSSCGTKIEPNKGENMTCSNDSKPCGWIEPPDGWEWIDDKQEYVKDSSGVHIRYMPNLNLWNVLIPSVIPWYIPGYAGYVTLNLEDALKKF